MSEVLADTPAGYWRFEESSTGDGTQAADSSGNARHGTYKTGVTGGSAGAAAVGGKSASFNGTTGYVDLPGSWGGGATATIEAWVNTAALTPGDFQAIVAGHDPNSFAHFQTHDGGGQTGFYTSGGFAGAVPPSQNPVGVWRHLVFVGESGNSRLYVDGALQPGASTLAFATIGASTSVDIGIGHVGVRWFNGLLDEVAIYNSALSAARIQSHYAAGVPEPSSVVLLGTAMGVLGLIGLRRRRRR